MPIDTYDAIVVFNYLHRPLFKDIRDGLVGSPTQVFGTSVRITPPSGSRHYSVIAVDARGNASPF